ncbi:hypothetical protein [Maridesulfovibrio hydrothermalis]|uniref:MotA/TolQ/ExbB proton channel domain-containing protein n=1 Tax=Maridesulfovibrio hydrothermalis AM13 = DSM 14728 TaxID=1121451 RepID=L0RD64_9BACT|nr:hypothetical protein [Maridesulfovibrio hydrothermalis]CCO24140.1 conserved membrane protein of unknown function [Maridesulfovibrio hydrothermalis AM13 = DSM 14728]
MLKNQNKYKVYLYLSIMLMAVLIGSAIVSFAFLKTMFATSAVINTVIIAVFLGSVVTAFRYILTVRKDIALFREFTKWCEAPEDTDFDIDDIKKSILGTVLGPIGCSIKEHGVLVVHSTSDSRSIIEGLEQSISSRTMLISFLGGFLVLLGLMGTFLGLTITLQSMGEILSTLAGGLSDASDTSIMQVMIQLIIELKNPMAGMGTAFSTSLFGLSGSAVVGILSILLSRMHDQLKLGLENWLNEKTEFYAASGTGGAGAFPVDQDMGSQLAAISNQLAHNNESMLEVLENTNKFLLKLTILQQRSAEAINTVQDQSIETTKEIGLGNELTGRLIKESRQMVVALERSIESLERNK